MRLLLHFLVTAGLIWLAANYGAGLGITTVGFTEALIFAVILALVNMLLGTLLRTLGMPLNMLTLGLFSFIVTLIVIWITTQLYAGVKVNGLLGYLVMAFIPVVTSAIVGSIKS